MKVVVFKRRWILSCALAAGTYGIVTHETYAQYRMPPGCACASDCTAAGPTAPVPAQTGQPTEPGLSTDLGQTPSVPQPSETPAPSLAPEQFASLGGETVGLADFAPNVIGDFFAGGCVQAYVPIDSSAFDAGYYYGDVYDVCIPTPGSAIGRVKLADNNSPMPRDRVFFDYNLFHNTSLNGIDVNRYTPGLEKTFLDGIGSIEFRVPMAGTLGSDVVIDSATGADRTGLNGEFGDLFLGMKLLLMATDECAISAGLGLSIPTADDVSVSLDDGTRLALIENEAVYVSPYIAFLHTPSPDVFFQGFLQFNVDASGNPVFLNDRGTGLLPVGRLNEQSSVFLDASLGRWVYRDFSRSPRAIALMLEAHYSATIENADVITSNAFQIGSPQSDFDILNITMGTHILLGRSVFTVGYSVPVTDDEAFDGEFRAFVNRYF